MMWTLPAQSLPLSEGPFLYKLAVGAVSDSHSHGDAAVHPSASRTASVTAAPVGTSSVGRPSPGRPSLRGPSLGRPPPEGLPPAVVAASPSIMPCVELALSGVGFRLLRQRDRQHQSGAQGQNTRQKSTTGDFPSVSMRSSVVHSDHLLLRKTIREPRASVFVSPANGIRRKRALL
jgi:hypothetical protein